MTSGQKIDDAYNQLDTFMNRYFKSMDEVISDTLSEYLGRPVTAEDIVARGERKSENKPGIMTEKIYFDGLLVVYSEITFNPIAVKIKKASIKQINEGRVVPKLH